MFFKEIVALLENKLSPKSFSLRPEFKLLKSMIKLKYTKNIKFKRL